MPKEQVVGVQSEEEQRRVDAFLLLNRLERGIRNYLQTELSRIHGRGWERALPQDIKKKIEDRGLAYADFPDLKKTLGSSWRHLEGVRPGDKSRILAHLEGLEDVRNDVAHSRDIPEGAVALLQAAFYVLSEVMQFPRTQAELPVTGHPGVALSRIKAAIEHHGPISANDLKTLEAEEDFSEVAATVAAYTRVKERPGRSLQLMQQVEAQALESINTYLDSMH